MKSENQARQEQEKLESAWRQAEAALEAAESALATAREEEQETEADLEEARRWLRAWDGSDPKLAEQLADSAEWQQKDPGELFAEITALVRKQTQQRNAIREAGVVLERAKSDEAATFKRLHRDRYREARRTTLKLYVAAARALAEEREIAEAIQSHPSRPGNNVAVAHAVSGFLNLRDQHSGLCYLLKAAEEAGVIEAGEPWLAGIRYMGAGTICNGDPIVMGAPGRSVQRGGASVVNNQVR